MKISKFTAQMFSTMIHDAVENDINSLQVTTRRKLLDEDLNSESAILHYWHNETTGEEFVRVSTCCPLEPRTLNTAGAERYTLAEFRSYYNVN